MLGYSNQTILETNHNEINILIKGITILCQTILNKKHMWKPSK